MKNHWGSQLISAKTSHGEVLKHKNHWLKRHEQRRLIWTAEFLKNSTYVMRPRRVDVVDYKRSIDSGSNSGLAKINFREGMITTTDKELVDLLVESRKSMKNWTACIRLSSGFTQELKYYELTDLAFNDVTIGLNIEDIQLSFDYNKIRIVNLI